MQLSDSAIFGSYSWQGGRSAAKRGQKKEGDHLTVLDVERVGGQSQRGAAVVALEAAAVEELALGAQPLHHVDALAAEEAHVAAADVDGKLFPEGTLWERQTPSVSCCCFDLCASSGRRRCFGHVEIFGARLQELRDEDDRRLLTS